MKMDIEGMVRTGSIAPIWTADGDWIEIARRCRDAGGRLVSLWGSESEEGFFVHAAYVLSQGMLIAKHHAESGSYPDLSGIFPCAARMHRALFDMHGIDHDGADKRPWLSHGFWKFP
ncbi:MAG TPA: NADH-quinone oxidoreductase subunit C, partial [Burkholderiales bacterium]|nr:NADH-quinone oxidoreductase subunit C [Burkholderiales bacterium]